MTDKRILARNLFILQQIEELTAAFPTAVLLKGAALIALSPVYAAERTMEDIDLLVHPDDATRARAALAALGYHAADNDPHAFRRGNDGAAIDLTHRLWYLTDTETSDLFNRSLRYPVPGISGAFHLPPDEFYCHILAHAAIHHARHEHKWRRDLEIVRQLFAGDMNETEIALKLERYGMKDASDIYLGKEGKELSLLQRFYAWILTKDTPLKGHVTRFLFLPAGKKAGYLRETLFPTGDFLARRYNAPGGCTVLLLRFLRPFLLCAKLLRLCCALPRPPEMK